MLAGRAAAVQSTYKGAQGVRRSNGPWTAARWRVQRANTCCSAADAASAGASSSDLDDPPIQAVIFDVDGVLCSSEHLSRE